MASLSNKSNVRASDFLWIKAVGGGGFGEVWKCHYRHTGVQAVKFLKKVPAESIEQQQTLLSTVLDHSRILLPVGYGISSSGYDFIMTEYATYGDLRAVLHLKRDLSIQRKVQMAVEIAEGRRCSRWHQVCAILHLNVIACRHELPAQQDPKNPSSGP
jgi:serine/threonine protein kinase